ncbi:calpain small subunit 1 [Monodelphis domestica]|uniref:calpain small subunit 1 n=1 Tax=Monodelphis domestica TaxID=13616 RepID=UPI0024E1D709|nr:calpain small subunit 1 [Monodelphis domestica]XP_056652058.1 calpain small subunit 1 [Monodelphis domestica]
MFLVNSFLGGKGGGGGGAGRALGGLLSGGGGGGGGAGGIGNVIGGLLSGGGGGGGGGAGGAMGFLGGVISAISEAAANYNPEPPPPRTHFSNIEANESEEVRQFRRLFTQLAGDDMEVSASELMNILNKVVTRHPDLKTDGFGIDTCRSMVAVMDSDTTGKLGFEEFKYLWNNIKKWQAIYKQFDTDRSGTIGSNELPGAFEAAGFRLNPELYQMIIRRYSDEDGNMDFDNFISCLVRLDAMFRAFKSLDKDGSGQIRVNIQEWLQLTMYS